MTDPSEVREARTLTPSQLVAWAEDNTQVMRLKSGRDVIPGGYTAAFAPVLVDWRSSRLNGESPYVVLRNVNYGGNPLERTVILQSARVPLDGITYAELTLVPFSGSGAHALLQHAQLRFVFDPDNQPQLLNLAGAETGTDAAFPDLILSWETWRAKGVKFSYQKGLDVASYSLTARMFAGPQLFLEDTLRGREWYSYRLRLPGGREGLSELFLVGLGLGDGVARNTISGLLEHAEDEWLNHAPPGEADASQLRSEWHTLKGRLRWSKAPAEELVKWPEQEVGYQPFVRSCATMARYTVVTAAARLLERGFKDEVVRDALPGFEFPSPEPWMREMAHADLGGVFLRAPLAVSFLVRHAETIPRNTPSELAAAGLLESRNGEPRSVHYTRGGLEPYRWDGAAAVG